MQSKLRLSTSAKGTVVAKKALVSLTASKKNFQARVKQLEEDLAGSEAELRVEKRKTSRLTKEVRVLKIVTRKGITLAETAYGGREGRRLIYGKARCWIAPKHVPLDEEVKEAIEPLFTYKNVSLAKCEDEYQEVGKNSQRYVAPVPVPKWIAQAQFLYDTFPKGPAEIAAQAPLGHPPAAQGWDSEEEAEPLEGDLGEGEEANEEEDAETEEE